MDINLIRTLITLLAFATFLGIVWWAFSPARKGRFELDGRLVFDEPAARQERGEGP
jgi:cbb3-type cytochrome oxidase subunit 3